MPPEWQVHECCWMSWPCRIELWRDRYENVCVNFAEVVRTIARFEPVKLLAPIGMTKMIQMQVGSDVEIFEVVLNDSWFRDNGPTFLIDGQGGSAGVSWHFNAWGNKYHDFSADDQAADWVLNHLSKRRFDGAMTLEGGAFDVDGAGNMITTETAVLNTNRNPTLDRQQIEERLAMFLGVRKVIWLPDGLVDDETDGHVDNVARFAGPGRILHALSDDETDKSFQHLNIVAECLRRETDCHGKALELITLPMPTPILADDGTQLCRSYLNFYLANDAVIIPAFSDISDNVAFEIISSTFPDRRAVTVDISEIVRGGGGIHCITQQQPKVLG